MTIPVTLVIECAESDLNLAKVECLRVLANKLQPEEIRYRWGNANLDSAEMGNPAFKSLKLKPVPAETEGQES